MCVAAFFITVQEPNYKKWLFGASAIVCGIVYWYMLRYKIITSQDGFTSYGLVKKKELFWNAITAIKYEAVHHGHGVELKLKLYHGNPQQLFELSVKQFQKKNMKRFFEMLNEQCVAAVKNDHFIKESTVGMTWKEKLKMY